MQRQRVLGCKSEIYWLDLNASRMNGKGASICYFLEALCLSVLLCWLLLAAHVHRLRSTARERKEGRKEGGAGLWG